MYYKKIYHQDSLLFISLKKKKKREIIISSFAAEYRSRYTAELVTLHFSNGVC